MPNSNKQTFWKILDSDGSFSVENPNKFSRLYFPLGNEAGLLSSITPDLHGDIKTGHNAFLTQPVSAEDLHNAKSNRNFWIYVESKGAFSTSGVSSWQEAARFFKKSEDKVSLEAGTLWQKVTRENKEWKLKTEITSFVPSSNHKVELMIVTVTNTGSAKIKITPTSAIPIFGRSADNLRDHAHVTSLLHRYVPNAAGVIVKPTMSFDERGHKINEISYGVLGFKEHGELPEGFFPTVQDFCGENGDFESPQSIIENFDPPQKEISQFHGKTMLGGIRFKTQTLLAGKKVSFVLILGIADCDQDWTVWADKFGSISKANQALAETKLFWKMRLSKLVFDFGDPLFNTWIRWVSLQPTLRKIFGCSFLPDFDYGRGGRGWRDLWQDCLALLLTAPHETRDMLLHNFNGIRIDGSNATIIGNGQFVADRNNITRVWMDHGVWPFITLELYIHQTGDLGILFENAKYFRDRQQSRAKKKDSAWTEEYGKNLKTKTGQVVEATILEHLLVQHLVQFFNVGDHNNIRLENADWNDGLDMAYAKGESVAFTALYASNLKGLADTLEKAASVKNLKKVSLSRELLILLDNIKAPRVDYYNAKDKQKRLVKYFDAVEPVVSGVKVEVSVKKLCDDLRVKSNLITEQIRKKEWIQTRTNDGFYNGYYDNHGKRVEGDSSFGVLMTLAGQVFPIMGNVATSEQVVEIFKTSKKYLKDKELGGFRLNTNFGQIRPDLGRAFSFAYGEKENGAFFSHMNVMFSNALYQRGFAQEGFEVFNSIYQMCVNTEKSKIYPGIPEYFNSEGRGFYHYLTGSASWMVLTLLTQICGIRGLYGDLLLSPKLVKRQFDSKNEISIETSFAEKQLQIIYKNPKKIEWGFYAITKVQINQKDVEFKTINSTSILLTRELLNKYATRAKNTIIVTLE